MQTCSYFKRLDKDGKYVVEFHESCEALIRTGILMDEISGLEAGDQEACINVDSFIINQSINQSIKFL